MARQKTRGEARVPIAASQGRLMLRSLRVDSKVIALVAAIIIGSFSLAPDIQVYLEQRQRIADMEAQIIEAENAVEQMQLERDRWQDPVYIRAQARDRLYYVLPGEVSYLVMDAEGMDFSDTSGTVGEQLAQKRNADEISQSVAAAQDNWVDSLLESVLRAALDKPVTKVSE